jgi:hypothetical protein
MKIPVSRWSNEPSDSLGNEEGVEHEKEKMGEEEEKFVQL